MVDLVGQDASGWYLVIMVESRAWGTDPAQASQLKEKINAYAGFITDGTLARRVSRDDRPTGGHPAQLLRDADGDFATILEHAAVQLQRLGIGFRVNVI